VTNPAALAAFRAAIEGVAVEDNPILVKQKSRDFYWYSPVLKAQLDAVTGDLVVTPKSEADVACVLSAAYRTGVPVTPRGSGTGNYGQAMPLSGGVVLNLAEMKAVKAIAPGRVVAEPGAILAEIDRETRAQGQELRMFPSTVQTASIGGFVAGGSGGVGSIAWGGLRDLGNVLRLKVLTMEATPRALDLTSAGRFGLALGQEDGILKKLVTVVAAPAPHRYFLRHRAFLPEGQSVVLVMVAAHAMDAFRAFVGRYGDARILFDSSLATPEQKKGLPPLYELAWNHTTLRALRVDPAITYLQVRYPSPDPMPAVLALQAQFPDELITHLEYIRFNGVIGAAGLPMVRYTSEARLEAIVAAHEALGAHIFNPHRYTLEEGGMKQTDAVQLAFKRETDPKGLLNPGKMIAWDDPKFDYRAGKNYLFPGLEQRLARASA
jgi:hypothetical protein